MKICLGNYGMRPLEVLADLKETGKVSALDHLLLSDCVWTSRREKELIKEHGMSVVFNGRMNERVKAGTAAVRESWNWECLYISELTERQATKTSL